MHINVLNQKTEKNRPLTGAEVKAALPRLAMDVKGADKIVALGKTAAKALSKLGVEFYEMPHPSGCNRLLNDPKFVEQKVKGLLEYCSQAGQNTLNST
jgi:uracil-DNA glycosylase